MSSGALVATVTVGASAIMLVVAVLVAPKDPVTHVRSPVAECRMLTGDIHSWAPQDSTLVFYICPEQP